MATLIDLDSHQHGVFATAQAGSGFAGTYDNIGRAAGITLDSSVLRHVLQRGTLKIIQDGTTATNLRRAIAAGNRVIVGSFYMRATAIPAATSSLLQLSGPTNNGLVALVQSTGQIQSKIQTATGRNSVASVTDGLWHRIDFKFDASGTTYTMDVQVDGVAIATQCTLAGQTAADVTQWAQGSLTNGDNATFWMSDPVISTTGADYPIGEHLCLPLYPTGEGTETLGSSNKIQDEAAGQASLYQKVDDWLAAAGTPNTSDYVTYASTTLGDAASNFAEFTFQDPISGITVVDVLGLIAGFANGTGADTADTQVLTAHAGTLIDHIGNLIDYSGSTTVLGFFRQKLARPAGGWDATKLAAAVVQWGRSTDTNAIPRLSAVMLEYAATVGSQSGAAALTGAGDLAGTGVREQVGSAALTGAGDLSATGEALAVGAAALTGAGDITAAGLAVTAGAAAITGAGALTAAGLAVAEGTAALTGAGSLSATGVRERPGAAALSGTGATSATGLGVASGTAALSGTGALTAEGTVPSSAVTGSAALTGHGAVAVSALAITTGSAALTGAGAMTVAGTRQLNGVAALAGSGALTSTGVREVPAVAALVGAGALAAAGLQVSIGAAALVGAGELEATAVREQLAAAALAGRGDLQVTLQVTVRAGLRWTVRSEPRWRVREGWKVGAGA